MRKFLAALVLAIPGVVFGACPQLYPNQKPLVVKGTVELCNSWYVVRYDENGRKPIITSEILDPKTMVTERNMGFKKDDRVKNPVRNSEYSGEYDKGHLVPADDASDQAEMKETFLLTNAVPQVANLNRGQWKKLEKYIRTKARGQTIYVLTGAIYAAHDSKPVPIPTAMYKVAYFKAGTEYWYAENKSGAKAVRVSKSQIEKEAGFQIP